MSQVATRGGKPIVEYFDLLHPVKLGEGAILAGMRGHQKHEDGTAAISVIYTSRVVGIGPNGEFETENTVYQKVSA